eukprot:CAMPEP_0114495910 /NCGR_PEP_ID=MMETSP0109-20121206/5481_1 /TAXON_ID=29199 /ORGANISM="Chlorarachnion reptans, Strain CCCM449" /LENGTH=444 /DNA_ID=CAMNT_0001673133 /DNA_START=69 /DNA_END=1403 /DNA_ORIENTATION=-
MFSLALVLLPLLTFASDGALDSDAVSASHSISSASVDGYHPAEVGNSNLNDQSSPNRLTLILVSVLGIASIAILTFVVYMCLSKYKNKEDNVEYTNVYAKSKKLLGGKGGAVIPTYSWIDVFLSVIAFMASSAGMAIANKMAVTALKLPMLLIGIQCATTIALLIPFYHTIKLGSWKDRARWFPVSLAFVGMLATSMMAYKNCSLGTVVVIRMISPLLGLLVELSFNRAKFVASPHTFASLGVIMLGVVLYAIFQKGIQGQMWGIIFMILNMFIATGERLAQRYLMAESPVDMSDSGLMLYNNSVCTLAMPLMMLAFNEWPMVDAITHVSVGGWAFIVWSCMCGACISYTAFRAQRRISATSFLVVVNMNKFVVVAYGIIALGEAYRPLAGVGCALALLGGAYYSWDRSQLKKRAKIKAEPKVVEEDPEKENLLIKKDGVVVPK